ncbi:MAG: protein phosphatase 2C domain-containing protein [Leptospiraceae bacterium]|nr:protein phosphatase 2C domain-containing protein [Leptospiraceae bacterium]MDW8306917.1 protein phosphatase 2C domain-containing protein [Leptospiraceae bacterium]
MISFATRSHVGNVREVNEDRLLVYEKNNYYLCAIADGMGGLAHGGMAAEIFVELAQQHLEKMVDEGVFPSKEFFRKLYENTLARLNEEEKKQNSRLGTTAALGIISPGGRLFYSWIGDSRIYLLKGGALKALTEDHSVVQELVLKGLLSPQAARQHPARHVVSQALVSGFRLDHVEFKELLLETGDLLLFCTDGLSEELTEPELAHHLLKKNKNLEELADDLLKAALSGLARDNISFILFYQGSP